MAMSPQPSDDAERATLIGKVPEILPILPLRGTVVFPFTVIPLQVGQERSIRLMDDIMAGDRLVGLVASRDPLKELPGPEDLYLVGTVAQVVQFARRAEGPLMVVVQGLEKIRLETFAGEHPYLSARIELAPDQEGDSVELEALRRSAADIFQRLVDLADYLPDELSAAIAAVRNPRHAAYLIATSLRMETVQRQDILELTTVAEKLRRLIAIMDREIQVSEVSKQIRAQAEEHISKAQREFVLREQLRAIQRELGEESAEQAEVEELRRRLEEARLPEEPRKEADRELDRLGRLSPASPEYGVIRTYLDWLASFPWQKATGASIDIQRAREILDQDHWDLERVKERILEYLAVRKLRDERHAQIGLAGPGEAEHAAVAGPLPFTPADEAHREPILCFVGPPGVGKTSLGQSIARALGRQFVRMSLGGIRDEAEIRGHRRTYIGALPGRIVQGIRRAGSIDPVFMLDEIDKLTVSFQGDPAAALLEVLDPAQNHAFVDLYLGVPVDLSRVMFVTTANVLATIPAPLLDRMEVLELPGYTDDEKVQIARRFLVPKQLRANGLRPHELTFADDALRRIVREYTREAGVRNLERQVATVGRRVAREFAEGREEAVPVTPDLVERYLGRPRFFEEVAERIDRPGVATGLAWTPVGGDILFVEAAMALAKEERLTLTGMLGDVMRESARAAVTYVRSNAASLGFDPTLFLDKEIHIHVPAGAIPKDGPSAGVTIATALASLVTGKVVRPDVAMTGEITLRGAVLPVGGIKEKVLAAHRAGIKNIILPRRNERDLEDIPPWFRQEFNFILVDAVDEVLKNALKPSPARARPRHAPPTGKAAARHVP